MSKLSVPDTLRILRPTYVKASLAAALLLLVQPTQIERTNASPAAAQEQRRVKHQPVPGGPVGADEKLGSLSLVLLPEGFAPGELSVPAGPVLLSVKKRVGERPVALELRAAGNGKVLWRADMAEKTGRVSEIIRLHPGTYDLTATGETKWECRISVTPPGRS